MSEDAHNTLFIKDQVSRCEDIEELKEVMTKLLLSQKTLWQKKINSIIENSGMNRSAFAKKVRVSRATIDKWANGAIPRNRETFIAIGLLAGYSIDEMNRLLTRFGRYPALYSKTLEDCVAIFLINNGYGSDAIDEYFYILDDINGKILKTDNDIIPDVSTELVNNRLSAIRNEDELERFILENSNIFSNAYAKLFQAINQFIDKNYSENIDRLSIGQGWSSSLKQAVYEIRNGKWHPTRNKIISIGIHLSMTHKEVDELLSLAHMEPLCAKNTFEIVIMYILDSAELDGLLRPDENMVSPYNIEFDPDELCHYALDIFNKLNIPEIKFFVSEVEGIEED